MSWVLSGGGRLLLAGNGHAWAWLAAGAVALILLLILYRTERKLVSRRVGLTLLTLRLLAAGALVLALFEPIAAWTRTETVRGRVIVAADASESMDTVDPGQPDAKSRRDLARALVDGEASPLARLDADHDVKALAFAREPGPEGPLKTLADRLKDPKLDSTGTDWSSTLAAGLQGSDDTPPIGIVIVTDGRKNVDGDATLLDRLAARGVPVYPVLVGSTLPPNDVAIAGLKVPESVYKGDVAAVEATIKADGVPEGSTLVVTLTRPGVPPLKRTVRIGKPGSRPVATFPLPLDKAGTVPITVSAAPPPGFADARSDNNARSASLEVADDKASVLLVDGEARWEFRYLRDALARDPRVSLDAVVLRPPPTVGTAEATYPSALPAHARTPGEPDSLGKFDAIVVGDADLPADTWTRLESFVGERGGTLVLVPGPRHWPAQLGVADAVRSLVPVTDLRRLDPEPGDDPSHPSLPPGVILSPLSVALDDATSWPMLRLADDVQASRAAWSGLPRLPWSLSGRLKPGASALVGTSRAGDDAAVFAAMPYGLGKVLWVGTDGTWRWRHRTGDAIHHRFWGQVVRWAASGKLGAGNRLVRFGPTSPRARTNESVKIQARIAETVPNVGADFLIAARVVKAGSKPSEATAVVPLRPVPGRPRLFEGISPGLPEGSYSITLDAPALEGTTGEAMLTVAPRETSERIELAADRDALDRLASATGGKVFTLENAAEIPTLLKSKVRTTTRTEETPLWDHPAGLFVFLAIVGAEWVLRKRAGLP
jgi:hypothetical protein